VANSRPTQGRSSSSLARTQRTQHFTKAGTRGAVIDITFPNHFHSAHYSGQHQHVVCVAL
jgi:hypothetical protein